MICERCGEKIKNGEVAFRLPDGFICLTCWDDMTLGEILEEAGCDTKKDVLDLVGGCAIEVDELEVAR